MDIQVKVPVFDEEIMITVTRIYGGDPGRTSGPPEHCYPPEPPEIEWIVDEDESEFMNYVVENTPNIHGIIDDYLYENIENYIEDL